ncbi:glycosyltransferase family 2 protein [Thioclava sp. SK-1]|uniref:glycosyltransferase family 2 protein n=1 Tax=Thioclava sp. SK-1 TaxID=1889770 RepID=UPI0021009D47|nr:glycosyltransferase family 2 protein [Thioclava sp. SK-1]
MKNEAAFLLEWLAHHRAVGVTDFLIFSNDCDDGTDAMLDQLQILGWLTHIRNPAPWSSGPQWDALKAADRHPLTVAADWILVCDVDEFVNIHHGNGTLTELIDHMPDATAIALTWRLFGNGGVVNFNDRPVTQQFLRAAPAGMAWPWRASMFKTLFRNDGTYRKLGVHRPRSPDPEKIQTACWYDGAGQRLPSTYHTKRLFTPPQRDSYGLVQLNHYALGAMESYVLKCARGRANRDVGGFDLSYYVERNFASVEDASIGRYAQAQESQMSTLRGDATIMQLHNQAVIWRRKQFESLMTQEEYRQLFGRLLLTPPSQPLPDSLAHRMVAMAQRAATRSRVETMATYDQD